MGKESIKKDLMQKTPIQKMLIEKTLIQKKLMPHDSMQKHQNAPSIIERKTGRLIQEEEYGQKAIYFLYHHFLGRLLLKMIFVRPYFSFLRGLYYNSFLSKKEIVPFVEKYGLSKELLKKKYQSFGAFFSRKEAVYLREAGKENTKENGEAWKEKIQGKLPFYASASGKVLAYKIDEEGRIILPPGVQKEGAGKKENFHFLPLEIKGNFYSIEKILRAPCPEFLKGGTLLIFRLSLPDYHRYIFPAEGKLLRTKKIKGRLDSVRKEAAHFKAFSENKREVSLLELTGMGKILHVEVGAMLVGHIHNHMGSKLFSDKGAQNKRKNLGEKTYKSDRRYQQAFRFTAGEEKGYFSLGGSTIVEMLNEKIVIDEDLFENTKKGLETKLEIGERIGYGKV
ncbi:phosphatidylserine decarboxylase [Oribacterium sinus]|uniref:Phosphatidylserine decarboxylase n=2 Tax=Oribacterium sinus TaxID=237576 RepID=A0A7W9SGC2_9FIRM|nr:phosphatidylserine decarboxylase [Oribacterium sinus]